MAMILIVDYIQYIDVPLNDDFVRDMLDKTEIGTLESSINGTIDDGQFTVKKIL